MKKKILQIQDYFIPASHKENVQEYRKSRMTVNTNLITALFALFYLTNTIKFDMPHAMILMIVCTFLFTLNAFMLKWGAAKSTVVHFYVLVSTICTFINCYYSGGLYSFNVVWFSLGPVVAVLLGTKRQGWFWIIIASIFLLTLGIMQVTGYQFPFEINTAYKDYMYINSFFGLIWIVFMIFLIMEAATKNALIKLEEKNVIIEKEIQKSDELLQNILPAGIIQELKDTGQTKTKSFDAASVMITNFTNFETVNEVLSPEELVEEIDTCYQEFDKIIEHNGLEIIKTIGHAYIAVCGLPVKDQAHAIKTTQAALEIKRFMQKRYLAYGLFEVRIGIHSGPMIAGIVGVRKFTYDIWGHTVNTASKIEALGEAGKINISADTFKLIDDKFEVMPRGLMVVPGEGNIEMFFVEEI